MKKTSAALSLFLLGFLAFVALCSSLSIHDSRVINEINALQAGWEAGDNGLNAQNAQRLMGVKMPATRLEEISDEERGIPAGATPPVSFDSRTQWPNCIGAVRNQGDCGSCWAFGLTETLSDRFCIHSNGTYQLTLAPLDIVSCDHMPGMMGCQGGQPAEAWDYAKNTGIVTEACAPYNETIPTCPPAQQPCMNFVPTPKCPNKCSNGASWTGDKHFAASSYSLKNNIVDIENEMVTNGPVQSSFTVYEDFLHYKSGIYRHVWGQAVGGHSIKIIGYGVANSTNYWLVQNSWTDSWGEDGYFMILRGRDECGIESGMVAGLPKLSSN